MAGAPTCWIIAGPNGAGKTTFALNYLPRIAQCHHFVNADLIAAGIAPLAPNWRTVSAGRVFLKEISRHIDAKRDFGFETTLSGLSYRGLIQRLREDGWRVELIYVALPSVEVAMSRVAERVMHGGHDIPRADLTRRFSRSIRNFLAEYAHLADRAECYLNTDLHPIRVFTQQGRRREVTAPAILHQLEKLGRNV